MITNQGWKAVAIGSATSQNFPQSLNVASVILGGYTDSFNTLLLNYAGFVTPLTTGSIDVCTNSGITTLASALNISTNLGTGHLTLESSFKQGESAVVTAYSLQIGTMQAAGIYHLTNGNLAAQQATLGAIVVSPTNPYSAVASPFNSSSAFNQLAGSVALNLLRLDGGTYNLSGGSLDAGAIELRRGGFQQTGGSVTGALGVAVGTYLLSDGFLQQQTLTLPTFGLFTGADYNATFVQTGGTNYCDGISVWYSYGNPASPPTGPGRYVLSDGVLQVSNVTRSAPGGDFQQWGGLHTNAGTSVTGEQAPPFHAKRLAGFTLGGGTLLTPSIDIDYGSFEQSGGTNRVANQVTVGKITGGPSGFLAHFTLSGGMLSDSTVRIATTGFGSSELNALFIQSGGTHVVTNLLSLSGPGIGHGGTNGYILSGGQLTANALELTGGGTFYHFGGTLILGGLLTMSGGVWDEKATGQQFGQLLLSSANGSNSTLQLPPGPGQLRFADSSSVGWSSQARLFIRGWNGSPAGGGQHQVVFGSNSAGLTAQQLGLIQFKDPAGNPGTFPARILPTGEIVPGQLLALRRTESGLTLSWGAGTLQSATNIAGPFLDVPSATTPYNVPMTKPQEFFRLIP